ncbi:MAG: glutathione S-transferase N-terminal domain-containing protein [Proteobacteria bacterium]|nr:glutathione S-transferase N-terminal domain-containing protein [Pseudomonadota bacterium]MBU6425799.1 glutathione S-transferase N-terminal domain-containing protein [Rhodospirillales bacterium]
MSRQLYDLTAADGTRFSPYCWRVKLALAHKNLNYETIPWHFTEKAAIATSGQEKVPVLRDGANIVSDSQIIADYLERTYPNEESLFGDPPARALIMFVKDWAETMLHPAISHIIVADVHRRLAPQDQPYFRQTREAMFKRSLEEIEADRPAALERFKATVKPLQRLFSHQSFIAGVSPNWADHIVFGALRWGTLISTTPLLPENDPILDWMGRVLSTYGMQAG